MTAIVTDAFKHKIAEDLFTELSSTSDSNEFHIGIGKTDQYDSSDTIATPLRNTFDDRTARSNLESIKKVTAQSFVVARENWTSGRTYDTWNDQQVGFGTNPYYAVTEDNEVYICLQQSKSSTGAANPSTIKPSYTIAAANANHSFKTSDGYRWKFLYSISAGDATNFLTSAFMPTQKIIVDSASTNAFTILQKNVQNTATPGQVVGIEVVNGGDGYSSAPTVTIVGNADSAQIATATATISGGSIVKVEMTGTFDSGMGRGYDFASATVTDFRFIIGTTATTDLTQSGGGANARIEVEVTWDEAVTVTGTPQLVVDNGNQSSAGYGDHTLNYSATGSTANRKRFVGTSKDLGVGDILTIGGTNIALNSGTIKDTADGTTVSSLVLSGLTAVTHTVLA